MIIGDFSISKDDKNIVFHFSVISSTEGIISVTEKIATVQNSDLYSGPLRQDNNASSLRG
ncbi:hypothetical protein NTG1052_430003 [Candidatus Nitrotoga sp. 1052]|nr:hypothetical protein NTG1052_430003 [Candidatus Nitrotoga sp. 1052]